MKCAYATLVTDDYYIDGALNLAARLKFLEAKYPLLVLYTNNVNVEKMKDLNLIKITHLQFLDNTSHFADTINKFQVFNLLEYDRVIFLDADLFPLDNLDHNFNLSFKGNLLYSPRGPHDLHPHGGMFLVRPDKEEFKRILWYNATNYVEDDEQILKILYYPYTEICFSGELTHFGGFTKYWSSKDYDYNLLMSSDKEKIRDFFKNFYKKYIERE